MPIQLPEGSAGRAIEARVMRISESIPFPAFRMSKGRLCAAEVVGTIQVAGVRINVLPKTDTSEEARDSDFLVNILHAAGYLCRAHTSSGTVRASVRDPLEIMISEAAAELNFVLRDGVPRRYREKHEDSRMLRGRIDFARLATRLPSDVAVLPVRHTPFAVQNDLTHCLLWLATTLARLTHNSFNRQLLVTLIGRLSVIWNGGHRLPTPAFTKLRLTPSEANFERAVSLAKLLSQGQYVDPTFAGNTSGFTMLFPLQHLFERAMQKILAETLDDSGISVKNRAQPLFLLRGNDDGDQVLRLKPDYLFYRENRLIAVADAKWKRLSEAARGYGARREDLYQVNAYLDTFSAENAVFLMPRAPWMPSQWIRSYTVTHSGRKIHLIGVDIEKLVSHRTDVKTAARDALRNAILAIV
ncbi:McrC family protein [Herbaspirillum frisingense]|uniref:McrC family protein n=1 Tax=Herbaspirillum frisingense TaxID=92645 RepID=UPI001F23CD4C|nr:McrC family protein [Herbaspirillum frisingense]UIN21546.1 McrC family protein [Herbaspirillum frisingense]